MMEIDEKPIDIRINAQMNAAFHHTAYYQTHFPNADIHEVVDENDEDLKALKELNKELINEKIEMKDQIKNLELELQIFRQNSDLSKLLNELKYLQYENKCLKEMLSKFSVVNVNKHEEVKNDFKLHVIKPCEIKLDKIDFRHESNQKDKNEIKACQQEPNLQNDKINQKGQNNLNESMDQNDQNDQEDESSESNESDDSDEYNQTSETDLEDSIKYLSNYNIKPCMVKLTKLITCTICEKNVLNQFELELHLESSHNIEILEHLVTSLTQKKRTSKNGFDFGDISYQKVGLNKPVTEQRKPLKYTCELCSLQYPIYKNYFVHLILFHHEKELSKYLEIMKNIIEPLKFCMKCSKLTKSKRYQEHFIHYYMNHGRELVMDLHEKTVKLNSKEIH